MYSREKLNQLIEQARILGFWDDVAHWRSELNKLDSSS